jgi:magnesium transporter
MCPDEGSPSADPPASGGPFGGAAAPARDPHEPFAPDELRDTWLLLTREDRLDGLRLLSKPDAEDFFLGLSAREQATLVLALPPPDRRTWMRLLAPDDAADVIQAAPPEEREGLLGHLDDLTRKEVVGLLAFAEDDAGGLMNPRYARVRPEMSVDEAIAYLRKQSREKVGFIQYAYVLDAEHRLLGVVSFRELFAAQPDKHVRDVMITDVVKAHESLDQEALGRLFAQHDLVAIPVVDSEDRMKGIVTVDDIVDVVQEEATEDIQKIGGTEALDAPYLQTPLPRMIRKRAGWLAILFVGEMFTATAMGFYEDAIKKLALLSVFLPLIISSGGNSGSQATTLVIRAMALGEVRLKEWWRVLRRELLCGVALGAILAVIGFLRIALWQGLWAVYSKEGVDWVKVALAVPLSVVGVVTWGTIMGAMLPFALRRLGRDPASASAPFVATLVDVSGLVIYFTIASLILL